jgi:endonuclease/exonuclease/phosphatase family metal-dependent hydrolase
MSFRKVLTLIICLSLCGKLEARVVSGTEALSSFNFTEIKKLATETKLSQDLGKRLDYALNNVLLVRAANSSKQVHFNREINKYYLRVASWNIERGFKIEAIKNILRGKSPEPNYEYIDQLKHFSQADIFLLNEVDIGMPRTEYKNIVSEFANTIGASYAFATEFFELNLDYLKNANPLRYKGLHGNAIVSRYPIKSVRILRLPQVYDWFDKERAKLTPIEKGRRVAAKAAVDEKIITEVRRGSRVALIAEIELPNKQNISVISVHLENRCQAAPRVEQMEALLEAIKDIRNPVILGGDFNSFEGDASPSSLKKIVSQKISDPEFLLKGTITYFNPYALIVNASSMGLGSMRKFRDPTVEHVPIILQNRAYKLFKTIEKFEFDDKNKFDHSGTKTLSYNRQKGNWSNSNQRIKKGFKETFSLNRSYGVANFKIDWFFVKPTSNSEHKKNYQPAFGRTLKELNAHYTNTKISDHNPITVDIIFG